MIDVSVHKLQKYYGANHILQDLSFEIYKGEKVGLLGKNGTGKTTLFKILAEDEPIDGGNIARANGKKIEVLAQMPDFSENDTVEDILRSSFAEVSAVYAAMKKIEGDPNPTTLTRYGKLMEDYERLGGYEMETKIEKICNGMAIDARFRGSQFGTLSGGEKTRVNLARILLRDCDILLLDEPTNHLDLASLAWLEGFIREFAGTVVVISHDRVFLDNVITRIIEIEEGKANFYSGNFSWYAEEKERRFIRASQLHERQQKEVKRLEDRAKWFVEQNQFTTKHHAMYSRIEHILKNKAEKPITTRKMTDDFKSGGHAAKEVLMLENVCKSYGTKVLLQNITLTAGRGERIALIGANGCGKTTLLKMLLGEEPADSGAVKVSSNIKIAYMSQIILFDDENTTVLETLRKVAELPEDKLRAILFRFRFDALGIMKRVSSLSGGEKSRLKLCLLMQNKVNCLVLDELTNHLDIESREWIEDAVEEFDGTLLFISHDRFFLRRFASKVWSMGNGTIEVFDGGFDEYVEAIAEGKPATAKEIKPKNVAVKPANAKQPVVPFEALIYKAEAELTTLDKEIEKALAGAEYDKMDGLYLDRQNLEERIARLYEEWDGL